jgi:hypothetical protein
MEQILAKLKQIAENPGYYKGLTPEEQAELFLLLLTPKKKVLRKPVVITGIDGKDGSTPVKDRDYLSRESSLAILDEIRTEVQKTLRGIEPIKGKDGKDAQITPDIIEKIVSEAVKRAPLPRFPIETTQIVLNNQDDIAFIKDELARLEELTKKESRQFSFGGGVSKATVLHLIAQNSSGGSVSFETVSKNLDATDATLNYTGENLTSIDYTSGITKTLNYTGENLTSVVLSGSTPSGITLTKTLSYTGDNLTGVAYS